MKNSLHVHAGRVLFVTVYDLFGKQKGVSLVLANSHLDLELGKAFTCSSSQSHARSCDHCTGSFGSTGSGAASFVAAIATRNGAAYVSVFTLCAASRALGETQATTTVLHIRRHSMSNTSFINNVSLLRRYGTCGRAFGLFGSAGFAAAVRARIHSFKLIKLKLTALVSSIRSLLCFAESAERSLPARSMTYSTPGRGPYGSCSESESNCSAPMVIIPTPWLRELVAFFSVAAVLRLWGKSRKRSVASRRVWV